MRILIVFCVFLISFSAQAFACDFHSVYDINTNRNKKNSNLTLGIDHEFTHFESNIKPPGRDFLPGQHIESNITQFYLTQSITDNVALELSIPFIYRDYQRVISGITDKGSESGLGDIALVASYQPYSYTDLNESFSVELLGGVKLPTGDTDRLSEESIDNNFLLVRHGNPETGSLLGGDDLTLGTGSYDLLLGFNTLYTVGRTFLAIGGQYSFRQEGDFDYRFGDDIQWKTGGGYSFLENQDLSLGLFLSGEYKFKDQLNGASIVGTRDNRVYLGPQIRYQAYEDWSFTVNSDFTISAESSNDEVVPRYRLSLGVQKSFGF